MFSFELAVVIEIRLRQLDFQIKSKLLKSSANPDVALGLLETLNRLEVTQQMLKKNPNCVETVKRLCIYVGNAEDWNFLAKEKSVFNAKTESIRNVSMEIYQKFEKLFVVPDGMPFSEFFASEVLNERAREREASVTSTSR